jgi:hypothetical protein
LPLRSRDPHISSQLKKAASAEVAAGQNAGPIAGPGIPASPPQAIERAHDSGATKFSNATALADPSNRLHDSRRPRISSQAKKEGKAGETTGHITGAESPVIFHQAIECIGYFCIKNFSRVCRTPVAASQLRMGSA